MIELLCIALASAFIANVVTLQNGPGFVFSAFRKSVGVWVAKKSIYIGGEINNSSLTRGQISMLKLSGNLLRSFGELLNCPYCLGPWIVLVGVAIFANGNFWPNWLITCGMLYVILGWINGNR